jgi:hypothetical protein
MRRYSVKIHIFTLVTWLIISLARAASAQHADVRPYVAGGQIHTAGFVDASSAQVPIMRVFAYDFGEDAEQPFFTQDPGFNAESGSGLPAGSQLLFNIVDAGELGLPANLSYWNGLGEVSFTPTPADETLRLTFGSQNRTADDSTSFVTGFSLQTVAASGAVHRHLNAYLEGSGGDPTVGIYLVPLELQSSDATLQKSLPFFLLYNNGVTEESHDLAIDWVQQNLVPVPEASSFLLATLGGALVGISRRLKIAAQRWAPLYAVNAFNAKRPQVSRISADKSTYYQSFQFDRRHS